MGIDYWQPSEELSPQEQALMKRLDRVRKLLGFLRIHRRRLFSEAFQDELASMYRDTGAGKPPMAPALMALHWVRMPATRMEPPPAAPVAAWRLIGTRKSCISR